MKVLFINSVCGFGSTGKICVQQARDFQNNGHEVCIAYGRHSDENKARDISIQIGNKLDTLTHALSSRLFDNHGFCSTSATKKFLKWAENFNPDLLWLHNLHGYYINVDLLFEWIKSRPFMQVKWTLHDCWAFTGHCTYFDFCGCMKWKKECTDCPQTRKYPSSWVLDNSINNFAKKKKAFTGVKKMEIVTLSQWMEGLVKKSFLKEYPVSLTPNTIDTNIFKPTPCKLRNEYDIEDKTIVLGVASTWSNLKGLQDFITLRQNLDDSFCIILVGLTKNQIKSLPRGIIGIERTNSSEELASIYTTADVFFNPTYQDSSSCVNLEAEACGTPVVTYNTGGAPETIASKHSVIVPKGDLDTAINHIIKHKK